MTTKGTVVLLTTHTTLGQMYERHLERLGVKTVIIRDIPDLTRRAIKLRPRILVIDEESVEDAVADVAKIRKQPVFAKTHIILLCAHASSHQVELVHEAGADDIIFTLHSTPRNVTSRIQTILHL